MSELGKTLSELKSVGEWKLNTLKTKKTPIGIKTPLEKGESRSRSLFKMHYDILDQIQDNLKNLIMTQKGERLGFPDYGTSLRKIYSNTKLSDNQIVDYASEEIKLAVEKYMPSINLIEFYSEKASDSFSKKNSQNNIGLEYARATENILIEKSKINILNKDDPNLENIYKITIGYAIPTLDKKNSIVLFINNSI